MGILITHLIHQIRWTLFFVIIDNAYQSYTLIHGGPKRLQLHDVILHAVYISPCCIIWGDEMALKACSDIPEVQIHVYRYDDINYHLHGRQYVREIALGYITYEGQGNMIRR